MHAWLQGPYIQHVRVAWWQSDVKGVYAMSVYV